MKYIKYITIVSLLFICLAITSCQLNNSTPVTDTSTIVPKEYRTASLDEIYNNLPKEESRKMMLATEIAAEEIGLPDPDYKESASTTKDDPNTIKAYASFRLAQSASYGGINSEQYNQALERLIEQSDKYPNNLALQKQLSLHYFRNEKIYAAIRHGKNALALDPNDIETATNMAGFYAANNQHKQSMQYANMALASPESKSSRINTALSTMYRSVSFGKLGYTLAAAESYLKTWQLMNHHRQYNQYDREIESLLSQTEFNLLLSAANYLQCGQIEKASNTLDMIEYGPSAEQIVGYFTQMITELPRSQRARLNMLKLYYRYQLTQGKSPQFMLSSYYSNCKAMSSVNEFNSTLQFWYSLNESKDAPEVITRYSYALGLELAGNHAMARVILKNCKPSSQTASTWLDFARLDRSKKAYDDMLDSYIRSLDAGPEDFRLVLEEIENLIKLDPTARDRIINSKSLPGRKSIGAILFRAILAKYQKDDQLAEELFYKASNQRPDNISIQYYYLKTLFSAGKFQNLIISAHKIRDPEIMLLMAMAYQNINNYSKAENSFLEILKLDKTHQQAITQLASLYILEKEYGKAEKLLLDAIRKKPSYDNVLQELIKLYAVRDIDRNTSPETALKCQARCYEIAEKWSIRYKDSPTRQREAESVLQNNLETFLNTYPNSKPIRDILCQSYLRTDKLDRAVIHANKLMINFQNESKLLLRLADIFQRANRFDLEFQARLSIWNQNQEIDNLIEAMRAARLAGMPSDSLMLLNSGLSIFENNIALIKKLEKEAEFTFLILRNYQEAVELFQNWLNICNTDQSDQSRSVKNNIQGKLAVFQTYNGQYNSSAENIRQLYTDEPGHSLYPAFILVRSLNIRGMYQMSEEILDDLITIIPQSDIYLYTEYAFTYIDAGDWQKAIDFIRQWQQERPEAFNRQYVLMQTLQRAQQWQQALELIRTQLKDIPDDVDMLAEQVSILINIGSENAINEATSILDELENKKVDPAKWFDLRIIIDVTLNQPQIAFERLAKMGADPDSSATRSVKAKIYFLNGESEKAIEIYSQLLEEFPDDEYFRSQYSLVLENAGEIDLAIEQLEEIIERHGDNAMNRNNLAYTMINHNRQPERAGRMIREAIYQSPDNNAILDSVGWYYYKKGEFSEALDYFYQAAASDTIVDPEGMDHLGDCLYRMGETQRAAFYWQRGLDEINRRIKMEKYLEPMHKRLSKKLQQYQSNLTVETATLFSKYNND